MLGRSHALSGSVAGLAAGSLALHLPADRLGLFTGLVTAFALAPDLDSCGSTAARSLGGVTRCTAWCVARLSGGHRHGTHSLAGVASFAGLAGLACHYRGTWPGRILLAFILTAAFASALAGLGVRQRGRGWADRHWADLASLGGAVALAWSGWGLALVPVAAALGAATHIAGDMLTRCGCPLAWPLTMREFHLTPRFLRFTTGTRPERWLVTPLLLAALGYLVYRTA